MVNTTTLAGILAASKKPATSKPAAAPKPAAPVARYIPSYAKPDNKTTQQVAAANKQAIAKGIVPKPTQTTKTAKPQSAGTSTATKPTKTTPTKTAKPNTDLESQLGVQETLDIQEAQNTYDAGAALRTFQREQANRQLTDALAEIDRAAIGNYRGLANDFAARGMARSGGFMQAESEAMADKTRADAQARQAVTDFLGQLDLGATADLNTLNTTKAKIMADYLARRFAGAQGG
ncbi:MAG: hypothetical protein EBS38_03145 [Actinobacteria bacterium]|nr:hypothetical protein [Actinomycetota bacterium]